MMQGEVRLEGWFVTVFPGGGVWESNPPKTLLTPLNGVEVREAHRDSSAPIIPCC